MRRIFKVENVKCEGCASTLKSKLKEQFGEIEVDLQKMPREIHVDTEDDSVDKLRVSLRNLGYPMSDEELNFVDNTTSKAKSFVSCVIGKVDNAIVKEKQ